MYEHLNWANQCILETLQSIEDENQEVNRLFSHFLSISTEKDNHWLPFLKILVYFKIPLSAEYGIMNSGIP